ncbi:MetQ/NlpA family ABC transporter substrate-binding protein [Paramicrobacterium agarici]|uniref:D-methionine transport system substrate-binding protein n=1 Tax=Paramicrobacterium agarici TaxID=630514 RepID=A0A2A9DWN5_9MICO|nr:MetQ/NlpA family ABC transporter substrate-binding protein [Microbacterium agarici]PFG30994.1 D-methionine transport system substrate-binding protein [Microbacterium agarici]
MKLRSLAALTVASLALITTGCSAAAGSADGGTVTIKVAATVTPMTDAVEAAAEVIDDGYEIELVPVSDYVQPNILLKNKEIDANLVQFPSFMEEFNEKNDANLVAVQPVYKTVVAFYSKSLSSLDELPEGGSVVIPNDKANAGRALQMLADAKLITLDENVERFTAKVGDITENPRDLEITQVGLMQLNTAYDEADAVFNLPSFARQLELTPEDDGLMVEQDKAFEVTMAARPDNHDSPEITALAKALTSEHVRETLTELGVPAAF